MGSSGAWGIFSACRRCKYQKSHEPILIFSEHRGPRIIIYPHTNECFKREGDCIGTTVCGDRVCFKAQRGEVTVNALGSPFPCKWVKF